MGGIGSGRTRQNRLTTEWFELDVRWLHRNCDLRSGLKSYVRLTRDGGHAGLRVWTKEQKLNLHFDFGPDLFGPRTLDRVLGMVWVACPYGGHQPLLGCENPSCDRWVQVLYGRENFLCRQCRRVTYPKSNGSLLGSAPSPVRSCFAFAWAVLRTSISRFQAVRRGCTAGPTRSGSRRSSQLSEQQAVGCWTPSDSQGKSRRRGQVALYQRKWR